MSHEQFDLDVRGGVVSGSLRGPDAAGSHCTVLLCGDVPGCARSTEELLDKVARALLEGGIAVARFEPRRGDPDCAEDAASLVQDATAVLAWLTERDEVDGGRIGVFAYGLSAVVAVCLTGGDAPVNGLCLLAPVTSEEALSRLARRDGAEPLLDPEAMTDGYAMSLAALAPIDTIAWHRGPTLVIQGAADRVIAPALARPYLDAAELAGRPIEHELVALADHELTADDLRSVCLASIVRFFSETKTLPPGDDAA
jgi:pimeloyl-ACP methyl ester carboxylesterase